MISEKFFQPEISPEADSRAETDATAVNYVNSVIMSGSLAVVDELLREADPYATAVAQAYGYQPAMAAEQPAPAQSVPTTEFVPAAAPNPTVAFSQPVFEAPAAQPVAQPAIPESPEVAAHRERVMAIHAELEAATPSPAPTVPAAPINAVWTPPAMPLNDGEHTYA